MSTFHWMSRDSIIWDRRPRKIWRRLEVDGSLKGTTDKYAVRVWAVAQMDRDGDVEQ